MRETEAAADIQLPILTRSQVVDQIQTRLDGRITDLKLSGWAFDRFYQVELGEEQLEPGFEDVIGDVLDELMFADDPNFCIDADELRALAARLGAV